MQTWSRASAKLQHQIRKFEKPALRLVSIVSENSSPGLHLKNDYMVSQAIFALIVATDFGGATRKAEQIRNSKIKYCY